MAKLETCLYFSGNDRTLEFLHYYFVKTGNVQVSFLITISINTIPLDGLSEHEGDRVAGCRWEFSSHNSFM